MKIQKQILTIMVGILMVGMATAIYGGECQEIDLSNLESTNVVYTVVGNSSNLEGLNISLESNIASMCFEVNYKPDNFTIIFLDNTTKTKEVVVSSHHTKYVDKIVINNTIEFIPVDKVVYVNNTINNSIDCDIPEVKEVEDHIGFFKKIWNWIIRLFN